MGVNFLSKKRNNRKNKKKNQKESEDTSKSKYHLTKEILSYVLIIVIAVILSAHLNVVVSGSMEPSFYINEINGSKYYTIKGDNNEVEDPYLVSPEQIRAKVITIGDNLLIIPKIGYITLWFRGL